MPELRTAVAAAPAPTFPLSSAQSAFFAEEMLYGRCYVLSFGVDFDRPIDLDRLDRALTAVVARHPLLRARFQSGSTAGWMSVEAPPESILTRLSASVRSLEQWCARPLELHDWPLVRAAVAADESRSRLRIVVHHAVFDGESKDILLHDLVKAYRGERLDPASGSLHDAPFWRAFLERAQQAATTDRTSDELVGPARTGSVPPPGTRDPESLSFVIHPPEFALVSATARRFNVSKFTIHLAAWHAALSRLAPDPIDIVTPVAVSTRDASEAAEIGPFVNEIPVRSTAPRTASFRSLAHDVAEGVRQATANRHWKARTVGAVPEAVRELAVSYRRKTLGALAWPDAGATLVLLPPLRVAGSDVVVRMVRSGSTTSGIIDVGSTAPPHWRAHRLEQCWRALLHAGAESPDTPIGELPTQGPL